jgi:hypothetical protein
MEPEAWTQVNYVVNNVHKKPRDILKSTGAN